MARIFLNGKYEIVPEGPRCSSCGQPNPKFTNDYGTVLVCDERCYFDWFVENAEEFAKERFQDDFYEMEE